jgi:symplekin
MDTADILDSDVPNLQLIDFKLPPPKELSDDERDYLMGNSVSRIWQEAQDTSATASAELVPSSGSTEMWMLLIVRMITRVAVPAPNEEVGDEDTKKERAEDDALECDFYARQDRLRQTLCEYIMSDFPARCVWCWGCI